MKKSLTFAEIVAQAKRENEPQRPDGFMTVREFLDAEPKINSRQRMQEILQEAVRFGLAERREWITDGIRYFIYRRLK